MQPNLFNSNLAEIEITYKTNVKCSDRRKITRSKDAEEALRAIWNPSLELREEAYILLLNRANRILGWFCLAQGGISSTIIDIRLVFAIALKCNAVGVILAHSHPSGEPKPSEADLKLTSRLAEAGRLLEIPILDHLIMTAESYLSFADEGLL